MVKFRDYQSESGVISIFVAFWDITNGHIYHKDQFQILKVFLILNVS